MFYLTRFKSSVFANEIFQCRCDFLFSHKKLPSCLYFLKNHSVLGTLDPAQQFLSCQVTIGRMCLVCTIVMHRTSEHDENACCAIVWEDN